MSRAGPVGLFLRATREAQKLSQQQLAELTRGEPGSVSRAMISAVERGRHLPGLDVLLTLSRALHFSPTEILERLELARGEQVETAERSWESLEQEATRSFWSGDPRRAVACYEAMARLLEANPVAEMREQLRRAATLHVRRGAALRRCGALTAARSAAERAIAMTETVPDLQAQAYVVLAATLVQVGCLPLARDAAQRAVEIAEPCDSRVRAWALLEKGEVLAASQRFEEARVAFVEAGRHVALSGERTHEIQVAGNIGACLWRLGHHDRARERFVEAVTLARKQGVPASEAFWLVELGRLAFDRGALDEAEARARAALGVAKPHDLALTVFRAEWLRHLVRRRAAPDDPDRHRVAYLKRLYHRLADHEGHAEILEFRESYCRPPAERGRAS